MMKTTLIYIFSISLLLFCFKGKAQDQEERRIDTIVYQERYGLRVGIDLSKPARSLFDKNYSGFEIKGDFRLSDRFFPAVEMGFEDFDFEENYFSAQSKGSFIKAGVNFNAYSNWIGLQNEIYAGLRYGFSSFTQTLYDFTVYDKDQYFPSDYREVHKKFSGLQAHWIEFQLGVKAEILHNVFLGLHVEAKRIITSKAPENFENLWIPGYNRVYQDSPFGIGWGYSVSYLIPFIKKEKVEKIN